MRPVSGIVLAAGTSSRFAGDRPKQLWPFRGEALVRHAVRAALASRLSEVWVVLGHAAEEVDEALSDLDVATVTNPMFREGQSTSVRTGLSHLAEASSAALFIPADQPHLSSRLIDRLLETYQHSPSPIVLPIHEGQRGAPVLFDRALFPELEELTGDVGGRAVLSRHAPEITEVPVDDPRELADVDTREDLQYLSSVNA